MIIDASFKRLKKRCGLFKSLLYRRPFYPGDYPEFNWQEAEKAFGQLLK